MGQVCNPHTAPHYLRRQMSNPLVRPPCAFVDEPSMKE